MKDFKLPGALWLVVIVAGVVAVEQYTTDPIYFEIAIVVAGMVLKYFFPGTKEVDDLLSIIEKLRQQAMTPTAYTPAQIPMSLEQQTERKPNRLARWLVG